MRIRASLITAPLTAGVAFAAAFLLSRPPGVEDRHGSVRAITASVPAGASSGAAEKDTAATEASSGSAFHDTILQRALTNPDLIAAVKDIMAHGEEDHCADTRMISLVENLSAERLAELSAVLDANQMNDYVVRFVLGPWAKRDAAGARAWVESHPALNSSGKQAFLRGWTLASPEAVLSWLDALPVSSSLARQRATVVEALSEKNPPAAFEMMKSRGWLARDPGTVLKLLRNWGGTDPHGAIAGLRSMTAEMGLPLDDPQASSSSFPSMLSALLNGAFDRNPADAAALLRELEGPELAAGGRAMATEVLARDPVAAAALFSAPPDANTRALLLAVSEESRATTLAMLHCVSDPSLQRDLLVRATSGYAGFGSYQRPEVPEASRAAVAGVLASIPDPSARDRATVSLMIGNAASAPAWAAELWASLPVAQQQSDGVGFFKEVAGSDAGIALAAYSSSPPGVQATGLKGLCSGLAATQPDQALQLILQRNEPALKAECAATLFGYWSVSAPETALAVLEANASRLDLRAILAQLPQAGHFSYGNGATHENVQTVTLQTKIRQLLGDQPLDK